MSDFILSEVGQHYINIGTTAVFKTAHDAITLVEQYALEPTAEFFTHNQLARKTVQGVYTATSAVNPIPLLFTTKTNKHQQNDIASPTPTNRVPVVRNGHGTQQDQNNAEHDQAAYSKYQHNHHNYATSDDINGIINPSLLYNNYITHHLDFAKETLEIAAPYSFDTLSSPDAFVITTFFLCGAVIFFTALYKFFHRAIWGPQVPYIPIQVLDVAVFDAFQPEWRVTNDEWFKRGAAWFHFHDDEIKFMRMIGERSGIGHATHFSPGIVEFPPSLSFQSAREEAEIVMFHCIDKLLLENNITANDIDVVVTNCSLFNPTPSLSSMIVNHYKMRTDVQTFHLGGMGCSASPLAVNVASSCLRLHPKKHPLAIVVSMENITQNIYFGRERAFMLQNALFRLGGAAILLTRDTTPVLGRKPPQWSILHSTHIHTANNTDAYTVVFQDIDKEDRVGVRLDKQLMTVAAGAITKNLTSLAPKILPLSVKLDYVYRLAKQLFQENVLPKLYQTVGMKAQAAALLNKRSPPVVPNFRAAVQHFCIHAGGRSVLDAIQSSLKLTDADLKPSRNTLYRFGNTSSSSIWYEYTSVMQTRRPKKGELMLSIAVGSGFKANLMVMKKLY